MRGGEAYVGGREEMQREVEIRFPALPVQRTGEQIAFFHLQHWSIHDGVGELFESNDSSKMKRGERMETRTFESKRTLVVGGK